VALALGQSRFQTIVLSIFASTGVGTGLVGALILARVGRSLLYQVSSDDLASYTTAAGVLLVVGVLAS
jgi:hypothetical protein